MARGDSQTRILAPQRTKSTASSVEEEQPEATVVEPEPEQYERQQAVRASMRRLDRRCQALLMELFGRLEAASYDEVAQRLGIAPNSVGPTRRRCLQKLLSDLEEHSDVGF